MNLHGSIRTLQNRIAHLYIQLEQRFSENMLIRELWSSMAHDVSQQIQSLNALPQSFWNQLKKEPDPELTSSIEAAAGQNIANEEDPSLKGCFIDVLRVEEPAILKVYAPLIRKLRENSSAPALDFYIMVKAHLARITRVTQSFAGDPDIIQKAHNLLQSFEKEVQEPPIEIRVPDKKKKKAARSAKHRDSAKKIRKPQAKARPLAKPSKILRRRPKPLVKKVSISRRRAR